MLKQVDTVKIAQLEQKAEKALLACFEEIPFVAVKEVIRENGSEGLKPDLLVRLRFARGEQFIVAEIKNSGQPRYARQAINQMYRYQELFPGAYAVFVAPYITPRTAEICTKEGIGYVDLAGNCRLSFQQVYISREGNPNPFAERRDLRSLYSPKAGRVLRVLLNKPRQKWKMSALAEEAGVSLGQVFNVKKLLADREWIRVDPDGFSLHEPEALLGEWSQNYSYRRNKIQEFYTLLTVTEMEARLAEVCDAEGIKYALTGFSGAIRMAPAARYQRVWAYVEDSGDELARLLNLEKVSSGANVWLMTPYDEGVLYGVQSLGGIKVASPIQIYLDLQSFRGRGKEAAEVLLEEVIRLKW